MCPQNHFFSGLSLTVLGFWEKKLQTVFVTHFPPKKIVFIFVVRCLLPSKIDMPPKIIFLCYFGIFFFFWKKLLNEKYSKRQCLRKTLYWFLSPDAPSLQNGHVLPQMGFSQFSQKSFSRQTYFVRKHLWQKRLY